MVCLSIKFGMSCCKTLFHCLSAISEVSSTSPFENCAKGLHCSDNSLGFGLSAYLEDGSMFCG